MEKIVDRHIRDGALKKYPLSPNQYAYQQGKSTETAILNLIDKVEGAIENGGIALCTFLDIQGAFDNTSFDSISDALLRHGIQPTTSRWVMASLNNRNINTHLFNETLRVRATGGCPQGGVLSPLEWSTVVDDLLVKLSDLGIAVQGYADDLVIVITGKYEYALSKKLQEVLCFVQEWCNKHHLSVNPNKTTVVPFTKKRKLRPMKSLVLFGERVQLSEEVKYLGITLDAKLNWNKHLDRVTQRATTAMWTCRKFAGSTWGLKPDIMLWLYTSVVRPMITYAAVAFWEKCTQKTTIRKLSKLQRIACIGITGAMSTAPTAALETLLCLPPLNIAIEKEARASIYRASQDGKCEWCAKSLTTIKQNASNNPIMGMISDKIQPKYNFQISYKIEIPDKKDSSNTTFENGALIWYTDGSKTGNGVGAGIYGDSPKAYILESLGNYSSIFQAEVYAILRCAYENLNRSYTHKRIYILSDSQAALKAISSPEVKTGLVWECIQTLNSLGNKNHLTLRWVPGHTGIDGNEQADTLAKKGASTPFIGPEPFCGISYNSVKQSLRDWTMDEMVRAWTLVQGLSHAKSFISGPSHNRTKTLLRLPRRHLKVVVEVLTGHCKLNKHLFRLGISPTTECRLCLEEDETAKHILCNCEAIARCRLRHLGSYFMDPDDFRNVHPKQILRFLESAGLSEVL